MGGVGYQVELERRATRELAQLQRSDQLRVAAHLDQLADNPRPHGVVKLAGSDAWRLRVGNYRIVYLIDDTNQIITVTRIAHRREVYRGL